MVATNPIESRDNAKETLTALSNIDMTLLNGDSHLYWMKKLNEIKENTNKISSSNEIETQRKYFDFLSQEIIETAIALASTMKSFTFNIVLWRMTMKEPPG